MTSQNADASTLRSVHTSNLPQILNDLGVSLLVTTYQAGKLVIVRPDDDVINTHFRQFNKPMGLAASRQRLSIGCAREIHEYYNMPAVVAKLDAPDRNDACFLPRNLHTTGDIDIHEMAWDRDGRLWFINTRFSALCTLDNEHSFVPRWRPEYVSGLSPEDRCHLNGLGMVDGQPRYVTALGVSDTQGGWRNTKANGGVLINLQTDQIVAQGLSMPHSPRWYDDRLWVLESGKGSLATVDQSSGRVDAVATMPGFTRGLDFVGPLAFVGLSQVRETAVFSGIPLTEQIEERTCGVWVINIQTEQTVAFLRFEDGVQEIFAVQIVPFRFPEILETTDDLVASSYSVPDEALQDVQLPTKPPAEGNTNS